MSGTDEPRITAIEQRQNRTETKLSEVTESQARLESNDASIIRELQNLSDSLQATTATVNTPKTSDYKGWLIALVAVVGLLASFAYTVISPIADDVERVREELHVESQSLRKSAYNQGRLEVATERNTRDIQKLYSENKADRSDNRTYEHK